MNWSLRDVWGAGAVGAFLSGAVGMALLVPFLLTRHLLEGYVYATVVRSDVLDALFEIVTAGIGLLSLAAAYGVLHLLMKIKAFNKLVAWTSLTHLPIWGRYRAPKRFSKL